MTPHDRLADSVTEAMKLWYKLRHAEHTKDHVCIQCFNLKLAARGWWTHKPGERSVKVGRYVMGK